MSEATSLLRSYNRSFGLEITTTLGCPVDCMYCPQEQLRKEGEGRKKRLEYTDFKKAVDNIDVKATLHWTGYSEPCLSPYLEDMVNYASARKFKQYISTTLSGNNKSVDFIVKSREFYSFQLHLPDNSGLMRGLKINESYAERLKQCLETKYNDGLINTINIVCFGEDFHPLVRNVILNFQRSYGIKLKGVNIRNKVYSRAGGLDAKQLNDAGFWVLKQQRNSSNSKKQYYCERHKLNAPVLIPDGSLSICSFDYGFRMTYGNLFKEKLSNIRKKWILEIAADFNKGILSPCTKCEFYRSF